jgi:hypothetical protein
MPLSPPFVPVSAIRASPQRRRRWSGGQGGCRSRPEIRAEQYRRNAAEARRMADAIKDDIALKDHFLAAERAWLELAERAMRRMTLRSSNNSSSRARSPTRATKRIRLPQVGGPTGLEGVSTRP